MCRMVSVCRLALVFMVRLSVVWIGNEFWYQDTCSEKVCGLAWEVTVRWR